MPARRPISLGTMMLFVAVCAALLLNLKIIAVDHREAVVHIWRDLTGTCRYTTPLRWSGSPGPPRPPTLISEERP